MGQTHPGLDVEAEAADEDVAVRRHDRDVFQLDFLHLSTLFCPSSDVPGDL